MSVSLSGDFVILPRRKTRGDRVQFSSVLWPEKCLPFFRVRKVPSINDLLGLQDNGSGSENWTIFLDTFLHFFCFKISVFFTPHVISRKLDSNYTLASARHRLPVLSSN